MQRKRLRTMLNTNLTARIDRVNQHAIVYESQYVDETYVP